MGNALCCFDDKRNYEINSNGINDYEQEDVINVRSI